MPSTSNIPEPESQGWPTHEQAAKLQEIMRGHGSSKVERHGDDGLKVTVGYDEIYIDAYGDEYRVPATVASGVALPLELLRLVLGYERVNEALVAAEGTPNPDYRVGSLLGEEFISTVRLRYSIGGR